MVQIVLVSGASVAIHKACDLASKLTQDGHKVRAILTRSAVKLVSPQLFEALTSEPAYTDEFGATRRTAMDHIDLARWGQAFVVALPDPFDVVGVIADDVEEGQRAPPTTPRAGQHERICLDDHGVRSDKPPAVRVRS